MQVGVSTWFGDGSRGAVTVNTPADLPGLKIWLDASDASTITKNGSNAISQWNDKSGSGNHVYQGTSARQPILLSNELNGKPTVEMTATGSSSTNHTMATTNTFMWQECSFFLVVKKNVQFGTNDGFFGGVGVGNLYTDTTFLSWAYNSNQNGAGAIRSVPKMTESQYIIISGRRSTLRNSVEIYENGALCAKNTNTLGPVLSTTFTIGSNTVGQSNTNVAEFIAVDNYMADEYKLAIENYLVDKWAPYTNFAERRSLHPGVQRYATANSVTSMGGLPSIKPLYLIFGQSNALGLAPIAGLPSSLTDPITNAIIWNNANAAWETLRASAPANNAPYGANCHGSELTMMTDLVADFGISYLLKYGVGGTAMYDRWRVDAPVGNLYIETLDRIDAARYSIGRSIGQELRLDQAVWWQGEADCSDAVAGLYQGLEYTMFTSLKNDVPGADNLKIMSVLITLNSPPSSAAMAIVNAAKTANATALSSWITTFHAWTGSVDGTHADSTSQRAVGNAAAVLAGAITQS